MKLHLIIIAYLLIMPIRAWSEVLDLSGEWNVKLAGDTASYTMTLPGTTDDAQIGKALDLKPELAKPQLLRLSRKHSYVGPAVYSKDFYITKSMAHKALVLTLGRVIWTSRVVIDGVPLKGEGESLTTPHRFIIPDGLAEGKHKIDITIDNRRKYDTSVNLLAHSYTDDTQIRWNGVLGELSLSVIPEKEISEIRVYPDVKNKSLRIAVKINNNTGRKYSDKISIKGDNGLNFKENIKLNPGENRIETIIPLSEDTKLWSDITPVLYSFTYSLKSGDKKSVKYGLREISAEGKTLKLNGKPLFLRGTLECCIFPLTGYPPMNKDGWEKVMKSAKEWGLNHLRFHSWCPPEAAFEVADSLGMLLQVELPAWATNLGDFTSAEKFLENEYYRISSEYGNHPSFAFMTCGNEMQWDFDWMNNMVAEMRKHDPRHLYSASTFTFEKGHGIKPEPNDQYYVTQWTADGWVRGQGVFDTQEPRFDQNFSGSMGCVDVPLVSHEIGQYSVYPNLDEIEKYTGVLRPLNFEAIREDLRKKGRLDKAQSYLKASGKLASILYKEEIERALKTPGFSGYQLLGLQDFPGQGTALVGLVDAFWENKGIVTPEWFRQFCSSIVPLASFEKAVYTSGEEFEAHLDVANYLKEYDQPVNFEWTLTGMDGNKYADGVCSVEKIAMGLNDVGNIRVDLGKITFSTKLQLSVRCTDPDINSHNSWNIWVYQPVDNEIAAGKVCVTSSFEEAAGILKKGGDVLLAPSKEEVNGIESKFVPVFWSPVHFPDQAGGMGILCDARHAALQGFPNDGHTDWQWWNIVKNAVVMNLDETPGVEPIIEVVDNFVSKRQLGLVAETKIGEGRLLMCSIDLLNLKDTKPEAAQLLRSLLNYMNSDKFNPTKKTTMESIMKFRKGN